MNWVQIVILVIVVGVFGVIIYRVSQAFASTCPPGLQYNDTLKKCVPSCEDNQILDEGTEKCIPACNFNGVRQAVPLGEERLDNGDCGQTCDPGQTRCSNKYLRSEACYVSDPTKPDYGACMQDGTVCPGNRYCTVNGQETCCPLYCKNNTCTSCPYQQCDATCCTSADQTCFPGPNGIKVCCTQDKWVPSSVDPNVMECCQNTICGGVCCEAGEVCDGNKCVRTCGDKTCDPSSQFCYTAGPLNTCVNRSQCGWTPPEINPQAAVGQSVPNKAYPVCQAQDGSLWLTNTGGMNKSKWIVNSCDPSDPKNTGVNCISSDSTNLLCNGSDSCKNVLNFKGVATVNDYTISGKSGTNHCAAQLDCGTLLIPANDPNNLLPGICNDIGDGRCVTGPDGSYTGQLCPPSFVSKNGKCICTGGRGDNCQFTRAITCNNHGSPNSDTTPTCDCDLGYCTAFDNKTCATPIGWQPKHDGSGIEPFNLFTHVYGSAYSIDTSYIQQNKESNPPFLVVLLPGITVRNNPSGIPFLTNDDQVKPFLTLFGCAAPATYYYNEVASGAFPVSFILDLNDSSLLPSNQFYHIEILMPKPGTGQMDFNSLDSNNKLYINNSIIRVGNISVLFIGMNVGAPPS